MGDVPTTVHPEFQTQPNKTMKALAWFGPQDVRIIDAPVPDITEPDDVILKVTGTTICGSDLHLYHGEIVALQKGDILGHEVSFDLPIKYYFLPLAKVLAYLGLITVHGRRLQVGT